MNLPKKKKDKPPKKGFTRSQKEWENSISGHIGRFIDRVDADTVLTGLCGYLGFKTFGSPEWAIAGAIGYKLARTEGAGSIGFKSPLFGIQVPFNSQAVGLGLLAMIGVKGIAQQLPEVPTEWVETKPAEPPTEYENELIEKKVAGETLTSDEEAYLRQRAMKRWVLGG